MIIRYHIRKHIKPIFPFLNVWHLDEGFSTDNLHTNYRDISEGYTSTHLFYGMTWTCIDIYGQGLVAMNFLNVIRILDILKGYLALFVATMPKKESMEKFWILTVCTLSKMNFLISITNSRIQSNWLVFSGWRLHYMCLRIGTIILPLLGFFSYNTFLKLTSLPGIRISSVYLQQPMTARHMTHYQNFCNHLLGRSFIHW